MSDPVDAVLTLPSRPESYADDRPPAAESFTQYRPSLGQQRFWVLDSLNPGDPALNVAVRWRIEGELSTALVANAFEVILARHEPLRMAFAESDGEPLQIVQTQLALHVPCIDLTVLPEADAYAECEAISRAEALAPFNLAIAPLIRATHVKVRAQVAFLLVTAHHAVCDGWSVGLLAGELAEICDAGQAGRPPVLPQLPTSYGRFSEAQREAVADGSLEGEVEFWSGALAGLEYSELPPDLPRRSDPPQPGAASASALPASAPPASAIESILLDRARTDAFAAFARDQGCTLFSAMLAALATLIHRYTEATDVAIGTQLAGRGRLETENLVGLFINTVVMRTDLSGDPTFAELVAQVADRVADAIDHGEMPLEKVLETLKPKRHPGYNTLFSVNFIFQRSFVENRACSRFSLIDVPSFSAGAMYDLNFFMVERPEGWRLSCEYNAGLYLPETVAQLLRHVVALTSAAARTPDLRLSEIPFLDETDRRVLLLDCNPPADASPERRSLPELLDAQAARTPLATAVVDCDQMLSYAEVRRRSTALARHLAERGFGPGDRIGVLVPRTADLVIAPLAVMRAGAAYVPLDPIYPAARLQAIVEQSEMAAIVVRSADAAAGLPRVPLIVLDDLPRTDDPAGGASLPPVSPDSVAYVIFTSGSTGRPKGVQVPHRALANFIRAMQARPGFAASDTLAAVTTLCFDIAALELFLPLSVGGKVVVASTEEARDGRLLLSLLKQARVNVLQATPSTWRMLVEAGWHGAPQLRMLCGGEALPQDLADLLLQRSPELWNMYGPTETTIWSSAGRIAKDDPAVCIGPPIAETQFYVADKHGRLVPPGAVGELLIGGRGVALGYWRMAEQTAARFIPDTFGGEPGSMLYRTGDVVRMRRPGRWDFLGRQDDQVKIRGFRIELGEIESVLRRHADVRNAVAVVDAARTGAQEIFCYVDLACAGAALRDEVLDELRAEAARTLPAYMRPAELFAVDAIPRLPNGKLDRKALPQPAAAAGARAAHAAAVKVDSRLKAIWCEVLGLEAIDDAADFFELGGQSLLAARMLAKVESVFGRRIGLAALFNASSLVGFAGLLHSTDHRDFDFRQVVRLKPRRDRLGIFAINNTGLFVALSRRLGDQLSLTGLQLFDPKYYQQPLPTTLEEVAAKYAKLVRQLQPEGPYLVLGFCDSGVLAFETARQLEAATGAAARVIVVDTWAPRYLQRLGPVKSRIASFLYRWKSSVGRLADPRERGRRLRKLLSQFAGLGRRLRGQPADEGEDTEYARAERFDKWLNAYLGRLVAAYEPKLMSGKVTVVRGSAEPAGWLLDMRAGWRSLARAGVELITVPGDHMTVFQDPGVTLMARRIEAAVLRDFGEPYSAGRPREGGP